MPILGLAIAAAVGVAKGELVDKPKEERKRKLEAEKERWSPWTGVHGQDVNEHDTVGNALQFGAAGAQMGAAINKDKADAALKKSMTGYYDRQGNWGNPMETKAGPDMAGGPMDNSGQKPISPDISEEPMQLASKPRSGWLGQYPTKPMPNPTDAYKSLYDSGINPDAPYQDPSQNPWLRG